MGLLTKVLIALGAFAVATLLAELFGAANLGTAMSFGQIAFALTVVFLIVWPGADRGRPPDDPDPRGGDARSRGPRSSRRR